MSSTPLHLFPRRPAPRHRWTEQPPRQTDVKPQAWVQERLLLICHSQGWETLPHALGSSIIRAVTEEANAGASAFRHQGHDWTEARVAAVAVALGLWPRTPSEILRTWREAEDVALLVEWEMATEEEA